MAGERILVVDDELSMREFVSILLERHGYSVRAAPSAEAALKVLARDPADLVITDLNMPGLSGIELMGRLKAADAARPETPVIVITAYGSTASAVEAMKQGASEYVLKPFDNDELLLLVRKALGDAALREENQQLRRELKQRYWFGNLVGSSSAMREVYALVQKVKDTPINCLITGESGTGKEMVARAIHYSGARQGEPFIAVNCGAIPESLIESELFGYVQGAFTGAVRDKVGVFEAAHGGTLFLDEIGDMPLHAQVKVLRAIAERKVVRVGAVDEVAVDVRILAATNRTLSDEVREGRFREDLYYRLAVVSMELPPLRERGDDVVLLAETFIDEFAEAFEKSVKGLSDGAERRLLAHDWPGNVRELRNAVELAVAMTDAHVVGVDDLPRTLRSERVGEASEPAGAELPTSGVDLDALLADFEQKYLQLALATTGGNRTQAAKLVGMSFRSFRYRLAKYGMDDDEG